MRLGKQKNDSDSSPGPSLDGSFRKPGSTASMHSTSSTSSKFVPSSKRVYKVLKEYLMKLVDLDTFTEYLEEWVTKNLCGKTSDDVRHFTSPFLIDDLRTFDFALEGVLFQQLLRMPFPPYASNNLKEDEFLALEDFLHTAAEGLWRAFWHKHKPLPYFVSCPRYPGSKFYTVDKAISRGRVGGLCGAALMSKNKGNLHVRWDDVVKFVLFKQNLVKGEEFGLSPLVICEALFYAVHILLSRSLSKYNTVTTDYVFVSVIDSKFGGVVKLSGDLGKLEVDLNNPYQSMAEWITCHAEVGISQVDPIWNKLGNVNWGDLGTLQILLAMFYSIIQWNGLPRKSMASLAANHSLRLQKRQMETRLVKNENENENAVVPYEDARNYNGEIVELDYENNHDSKRTGSRLNLNRGEILLLEDQNQGLKSFQIQEFLDDGNGCSYIAIAPERHAELLMLYLGAHPSRLEPSWEDMNLWYQVQRQTKVLKILKEQGISGKNLPEIIAAGRIVHSGNCEKQSPKGRCDHPWCGTPMLVTCPAGEPVSSIIAHNGPFSAEEATRCCRDCLSALRSAKMANILHGDIRPENIIRIIDEERGSSMFVLVSWGRAVLEDRDSPALNLQFSSAHALQHGKLCPSSDVESLVYLIYFICGGPMQQQDSIESALKWRQKCWAKRVIQQRLGEVSQILKAFVDYVDSICGMPYAVDYDVWLKRLSRAIDGSTERGKMIQEGLRLKDVAESSGGNSL
ncbi:Casein kinase (serine/threonine/tyrosine protein kinase) [Handroanthus impetiginosus]|uniref:Casein kinase (Serine/threonine/tyrosine protein kinase) n=1 Tax=Handroanthus impetiginosus TaxID=429701 RepID=A0A2G9GXJ9_9LAMI|nr:Casein kinase (serine/threonine/tyrosine protein kinase) [Handroanthus impetiginosus]